MFLSDCIGVWFPSITITKSNRTSHCCHVCLANICIRGGVSGSLIDLIVGPALPTHVSTRLKLGCELFIAYCYNLLFCILLLVSSYHHPEMEPSFFSIVLLHSMLIIKHIKRNMLTRLKVRYCLVAYVEI